MADPQVENGHVRIAFDLYEALTRSGLTGAQYAVMLAIIRESYGWSHKQACISRERFAELTGLDPRSVTRAIASLKEWKMISVKELVGKKNVYAIQKDWEKWTPIIEQTPDRNVQGIDTQTLDPNIQGNISNPGQPCPGTLDPNVHTPLTETSRDPGQYCLGTLDPNVQGIPYRVQQFFNSNITTSTLQQDDIPESAFALWESWPRIIQEMQQHLNKATFQTWILPILPVSFDGQMVTLQVATQFAKRWLEKRHLSLLLTTLEAHLGSAVMIDIRISDQPQGAANE